MLITIDIALAKKKHQNSNERTSLLTQVIVILKHLPNNLLSVLQERTNLIFYFMLPLLGSNYWASSKYVCSDFNRAIVLSNTLGHQPS